MSNSIKHVSDDLRLALRAQADDFMTQNRQALNTLPERPGGVPFLVGWHDGDLVLLKSGGMVDLRMLGLGR